MTKVTLEISTSYERETISLDDEVSVGRTAQADIVLDDPGLSGLNTTFFLDEDDVLVVDENSSNGTFLNGKRLGREPRVLLDGDRLSLGSDTRIKIVFGERDALDESFIEGKPKKRATSQPNAAIRTPKTTAKAKRRGQKKGTPVVLLVAMFSTFGIVFLAIVGLLIANYVEQGSKRAGKRAKPTPKANVTIPILVIDPLPGKEKEELKELVQYWEVQEEEIKVEDMQEITADTTEPTASSYNLNVSLDFWKKQYGLSRQKLFGNNPPGMKNFRELCCGVPKQTRKISEMRKRTPPYQVPMDFADLARKRMAGELIELPMATEYWVLDVGGSSNTKEFTNFEFETGVKVAPPGSDDYNTLAKLAENFSGVRYDMDNPTHRRQMKIRLLRMFHPKAKPVLEKLAKSYHAKYNRPLRITSLARSMEYQISLNRFNPNSYRVRGSGSLPPHTSGCAFDLSRKFMSGPEQNFIQEMLVEMENARILDGLREGNVNACFHVFIYDDGNPPQGY